MNVARKAAAACIFARLSLLLVVLLPSRISACICFVRTFCEYFETADVVLHAEVINRTEALTASDDTIYAVKTIDVFKDDSDAGGNASEYAVGETFDFTTARWSATCGVSLEIGEAYLLGLSRDEDEDDELSASLCGITTAWTNVSDNKEKLLESGCDGRGDGTTHDDDSKKDDDDGDQECQEDSDCGESAECLEAFSVYYCSPTCDPNPCEEGEVCALEPSLCTADLSPCPPTRTCTFDACEGDCGKYEACIYYVGYSSPLGTYLCVDTCDPNPCEEDEVCELQLVACIPEDFCPDVRSCLTVTD